MNNTMEIRITFTNNTGDRKTYCRYISFNSYDLQELDITNGYLLIKDIKNQLAHIENSLCEEYFKEILDHMEIPREEKQLHLFEGE